MVERVKNVAEAAGALFAKHAEESVAARERFTVNLSGGSTPLKMYAWLVAQHAEAPFWKHTHFFWGDERFVPHDHSDSNYGAAKAALLDPLGIAAANVHPWPYHEGDPDGAAADYADLLQQTLGDAPFDLTLLGLGDDAHTASLFPGTGAVFDEGRTTVVRPPGKETRLSLTSKMLSHSRTVVFLVQGEGKLEALERTLAPDDDPNFDRTPARAISAHEALVWLTDVVL